MRLELRDHYEDPNENCGEWEPWHDIEGAQLPTELVEETDTAKKVNSMASFSHGLVSEIVFAKRKPVAGTGRGKNAKRKIKNDKGYSREREEAKRRDRQSKKKK